VLPQARLQSISRRRSATRFFFFRKREAAKIAGRPLEGNQVAQLSSASPSSAAGNQWAAAIGDVLVVRQCRYPGHVDRDRRGAAPSAAMGVMQKNYEATLRRPAASRQMCRPSAMGPDHLGCVGPRKNVKDGRDLIIEGRGFETMAGEKESVRQARTNTPSRAAVLASNTSYLKIDEIAQGDENVRRTLARACNFFSPANVMKLCEIVCEAAQDRRPDALVTRRSRLARKGIAKVPAVVGGLRRLSSVIAWLAQRGKAGRRNAVCSKGRVVLQQQCDAGGDPSFRQCRWWTVRDGGRIPGRPSISVAGAPRKDRRQSSREELPTTLCEGPARFGQEKKPARAITNMKAARAAPPARFPMSRS